MLKNRGKSSLHLTQGKVLKKNPEKGIRDLDQVPEQFIKRVPFWRKDD